jgi:CDP-diacylglycerol--glycerol-3-phosphate 3-phosphatidyltransferase
VSEAPSPTTAAPAPKKRRWITANQITIVRMLALPFPCWALIVRPEQPWMWVAFVFGALVGATDFVDGWLARRDGPTVLGGLLDPVADKLFIAMLLLPLVASGECPGWAAGLLFIRELLITTLRTSLQVRKQSLKTSQLGKLKTVVQMGGIATYYLTIFVPRPQMPWVQFACAFGMLVLCFVFAWRNHRRGRGWLPPVWLLGGTPLWFLVGVGGLYLEPLECAFWQFITMVVLTWVSGADYLWGAGRALVNRGLRGGDFIRVVGAIAHGLALIPILGDKPFLVVPTIAAVCAELAYGGVDNAVSAERGRFAKARPSLTALVAIVVGGFAWAGFLDDHTLLLLAWILAGSSIVNTVVAFVVDRDVFLAPDRPLVT